MFNSIKTPHLTKARSNGIFCSPYGIFITTSNIVAQMTESLILSGQVN